MSTLSMADFENVTDSITDMDWGDDDTMCRIERQQCGRKRALYVWLRDLSYHDVYDMVDRNPSLLHALREAKGWYETWTTCMVVRIEGLLYCQRPGLFPPPSLPSTAPPSSLPSFNALDMEDLQGPYWGGCKKMRLGNQVIYIKVARWDHEIAQTARELHVYNTLSSAGNAPAPKLLGIVHEETRERVVGFALEALHGPRPTIDDIAVVRAGLNELHASGIAHRKLDWSKIVMTEAGPKFVDFSGASIQGECEAELFQRGRAYDLASLPAALARDWDKRSAPSAHAV